jgi:hypothetical protein
MNTLPLPKPAAWQPLPGAVPIALLDLTSKTCAWPVGEASGAAQLFCGCAVSRRGFCVDHAARAFVKTPNGDVK